MSFADELIGTQTVRTLITVLRTASPKAPAPA
jgi:hypothetical protein